MEVVKLPQPEMGFLQLNGGVSFSMAVSQLSAFCSCP